MEFKTITAEDKDLINSFIGTNASRLCENTFGVMYMWSVHDEYSFCIEDGALYYAAINKEVADFYFPIGKYDPKTAIAKIDNYCKENKLALQFSFVSDANSQHLKNYFGEKIVIEDVRDWADYLYNYEDLMNLTGKKYHGQKNHINRFLKQYPSYQFLPYNDSMRAATCEFLNEFYDSNNKESKWFSDEKFILKNKLLKQYSLLGQRGAVIKVDNRIIAITFGEIVGDTLYVHFEKALREYNGIYAIINQSFCNYCYNEGLKYINREEDTGDFGLRTSKLSLHPIEILSKHFAQISE